MRLAVHRAFEVPVGVRTAWANLERLSEWPVWAPHIRSVEQEPPGPLTAETVGLIRLTNGISSRFRMTEFDPPRSWTWEGKFLWMPVRYAHAFDDLGPKRTRIRFDVHLGGFGKSTLGRLFACIYARNLDKAIPNLVARMAASERSDAG
jgi:hypothetical protein